MRIKDVQFDEYGAVVWLPKSKTVSRKLRVVFSTQYLAAWLADHPLKDDPEAPFWIKLTGKNYLQPMEYKDIQSMATQKDSKEGRDQKENISSPFQAYESYEVAVSGF